MGVVSLQLLGVLEVGWYPRFVHTGRWGSSECVLCMRSWFVCIAGVFGFDAWSFLSVLRDHTSLPVGQKQLPLPVRRILLPHHEDPSLPLKNSPIDGELVLHDDLRTETAREPQPSLQVRAYLPTFMSISVIPVFRVFGNRGPGCDELVTG